MALYELQQVDSQIDEIERLKGELPLVVEDLTDEVEGLKTREDNIKAEIDELTQTINSRRGDIDESGIMINRYEEQLKDIKNNREYDNLNKEIEFQKLEIELSEKRIAEHRAEIKVKEELQKEAAAAKKDREIDLDVKKKELDGIEKDTADDMARLTKEKEAVEEKLAGQILRAYKKIRKNVRNGRAVVTITRGACGGCYNRIPPQRQLEIRQNRKIVDCEYCGRIIVSDLLDEDGAEVQE